MTLLLYIVSETSLSLENRSVQLDSGLSFQAVLLKVAGSQS